MRSNNGRFAINNRLPQDASSSTVSTVTKSLGGAALQAVVLVTAVKLVDAVFAAVANKTRRTKAVKQPAEPVAT